MKIHPITSLVSLFAVSAFTSITGCVAPVGYPATATVTYQPGYYTATLPPGYHTAVYGGVRYYVHGDVYYRPRGTGYVVVRRPGGYRNPRPGVTYYNPRTGTVVRELPRGYTVTTVRGRPYYVYQGVYYSGGHGRYVVVERPY